MSDKDNPPTIDSATAKIIAYIIVAVFVGVMAVMGVRSVSGPQLYAGDKLETKTCRRCEGSGREGATEDRCRGCLGVKQVKVILPGPEHPVEVRGTIRDLSAFKDQQEAEETALREAAEQQKTLKPVPGAVRGARLVFKGSELQLNIDGKATGRFRCALTPGEYSLTVTAEGFKEKQQQLTVAARQQPIWPKMPGLENIDEEAIQLDVFLSP